MNLNTTERIAPYILAGGRSSRMGRDKAMISLAGKTLLARTVETLKSVASLSSRGLETRVTVIGDRTLLEGANRSIPDRYPGCGPLGGMEAALNDLEETRAADWALFLPVDMPFLPAELLDALLAEWAVAAQEGARVCHVVVDGRPQPLVSLLHRELHPFVLRALQREEYKVTPVLEAACAMMVRADAGELVFRRPHLFQTMMNSDQSRPIDSSWLPTETQRQLRPMWFANINSQHDITEAETFFFGLGSMNRQAAVPD